MFSGKRILIPLLLVIFLSAAIVSVALAIPDQTNDKIKMVIDGEAVTEGIEPIADGSTVLVPARTVCEYLGADFEYSEIDGKVGIFLSDTTTELLPGAPYADVNSGSIINLESPPVKIGEDIMLPLELVKISFGAEVKYDEPAKTIYINYFSRMSGMLVMGGAPAFINISQKAIDYLKNINKDFDARVLGGGSAAGITACMNGEFDIANITRELTAEEAQTNLTSYRTAKEGIAVVVNPKNPVNDLKMPEICKIFEGKYMSWKTVGGNETPVFVNIQEAGSGTLNTFFDIAIMGYDEFGYLARTAMPNASNGLVRQAVASEPLAVGFVTFSFLDKTVKAVSIGDIKPEEKSVLEKKWPLVNKLNVVTKGKAEGLKAKYINFLRSKKGRQIIEEERLINLELDTYRIDERLGF